MTVKQYKQVKLVLMMGLIALVGWSVWSKESMPWKDGLYGFPVFVGLFSYFLLVSLLKTRVRGILADERQVQVSEKAAQVSFQILLPMLALTSVAMMMGGGNTDFFYIRTLGVVISYVTCLGLLIYLLSYWYFDRQSGGSDRGDKE